MFYRALKPLLIFDANGNGQLDTTETWTYSATRIVTAGQYTNIVQANAVVIQRTCRLPDLVIPCSRALSPL